MKNEKMFELRTALKKTQKCVADAVGITQSSYAMIEGGYRHPRKEVQEKLADYFGVTIDELFFNRNYHAVRLKKASTLDATGTG